jgi:hypothetical protein
MLKNPAWPGPGPLQRRRVTPRHRIPSNVEPAIADVSPIPKTGLHFIAGARIPAIPGLIGLARKNDYIIR